MITLQEKLDRLKEYNPFVSSSAGNPWEGRYPDVPSINKEAFDGLCRLLAQKAQSPKENFGALVLGEVGSGKTHLIGRILEHTRERQPPACFAYIQPIEDPEQTYRYLLREIVINLLHPIDATSHLTQLERLLAEIIKEYLEQGFKPQNPDKLARILRLIDKDLKLAFRVTINKQDVAGVVINYLLERCPPLPGTFLKVLFHYRIPEKRPAAVSWLKGDVIDSDDACPLGITINPEASEAFLEKEAQNGLEAIGLLLERYRHPMLVCFDRLENLDTKEKVCALETMLEFLIDRVPALLPVVFVRGKAWEDRFSKDLNQHVTTRLETNKFELEDCATAQALEIIQARLAFAYGVERIPELSPFDEEVLRKKFAGYTPPRIVITLANKQLAEILKQPPPVVSPLDKLQEEFEGQYQAIRADFGRYEPDRGRLRRALELYLRNSSDERYETVSLRRDQDRYIDLIALIKLASTGTLIPTAFIIDTQLHHASVNASLLRGIKFLEHHPAARAFYIRDQRCPLPAPPRWQATNATLKRFKDRGGVVLYLNEQDAARWYALALLHHAVTEGDVTILGKDDRVQAIAQGELSSFIQERLHGRSSPCFEAMDAMLLNNKLPGPREEGPPPPPSPLPRGREGVGVRSEEGNQTDTPAPPCSSHEQVAQKMLELLRPLPMMMMHSNKLAEALSRSSGKISVEQVLGVISQFTDRFVTFPSKDGVLVMVKKDWLHAQD